MDEIAELKKIYLASDIDADDYQENLDEITEWEKELFTNEAMKSWQEHEVTKKILAQAEESYIAISTQLAMSRTLSDEERKSLWAKQDACLWIISLASQDVKTALTDIKKRIKTALNATK